MKKKAEVHTIITIIKGDVLTNMTHTYTHKYTRTQLQSQKYKNTPNIVHIFYVEKYDDVDQRDIYALSKY